jgi:uncharacterized membrane protein YphA (DoxX/SURF4 family)
MPKSISLTSLSIILGCLFIFVGLSKTTPNVNSIMYENWREEFGRYNKVFPLYRTTGWRPLAKNYRLIVGLMEVICGFMLLLIPFERIKFYATIILLNIMIGALYTHYYLMDSFEMKMPSLFLAFLLISRLIISYLEDRRERVANELKRMRKLIDDYDSMEKSE